MKYKLKHVFIPYLYLDTRHDLYSVLYYVPDATMYRGKVRNIYYE